MVIYPLKVALNPVRSLASPRSSARSASLRPACPENREESRRVRYHSSSLSCPDGPIPKSPLSPLELTLTRNGPDLPDSPRVNPLESILCFANPFRINSCEKDAELPQFTANNPCRINRQFAKSFKSHSCTKITCNSFRIHSYRNKDLKSHRIILLQETPGGGVPFTPRPRVPRTPSLAQRFCIIPSASRGRFTLFNRHPVSPFLFPLATRHFLQPSLQTVVPYGKLPPASRGVLS
jgi:hypothetical protein